MTDSGRMSLSSAPAMDYDAWLSDVKARVRATQVRAARAANVEVLKLYWSIGHDILERQRDFGWGAKIIEQISKDLSHEFPGQRGFSRTNLEYMRRFADAWPMVFRFPPRRVGETNGDAPSNSEEMADSAIVPHSVGELLTVSELPWGHIRVLLDRLKTPVERDWYAERAAAEGWKRSVLEHYIAVGLMHQIGAAPSNFAQALDAPDSELAQQLVKDPYVFEHLAFVERIDERSIEDALMAKLEATLLEFGRGFAFVGRQVRLDVEDQYGDIDEFVVDLLLFHIPQARYVVVELKTTKFEPAYLGQLGTYVAIVDGQVRDPAQHAPTIGVLLCTNKNEATVRYALSTTALPIGVADYRGLPPEVLAALPSVEELQTAISEVVTETSLG